MKSARNLRRRAVTIEKMSRLLMLVSKRDPVPLKTACQSVGVSYRWGRVLVSVGKTQVHFLF